jgi:hypothetical protein
MMDAELSAARPMAADGLELVEAPDGLIVYDPANERVHHLNQTAAVVLGLCDGSQTVGAIAAAVGAMFSLDAPPDELIIQCIEHLQREHLIA